MIRVNWDDFNRKNRDKTKAFEDMCRILFLRKFKLSSYDYDYNYNQAGLEFEPIYNLEDKKWYGAQCKYFSEEDNKIKYAQIYKSLKKAIKYYKGKLDCIIIYTNAQLQHICTEEEIADSKLKSDRVKIIREERKSKIKLIWMQADNIADTLNESINRDLVNLYFSDSRELEYYEREITIEEKTFLKSKEYIDLRIKNHSTISCLKDIFLDNRINVLLGVAGTGKTLAMKKIYMDFSDEFYKKYYDKDSGTEEVYLPIFIRLRECINGNLEDLVRERLKDYGLNYSDCSYKYIYLLDGLDELAHDTLDKVITFVERVAKESNSKSIIISSRSDSNNLLYLYQQIKCPSYEIDKLSKEDIKQYFENKSDKNKIKYLEKVFNEDLIKELEDIFSVNLLWENIERIDEQTSKIEIIELSIHYWLENYSKYPQLQILEPKQKGIFEICKKIAYEMQKKMSLSLLLEEVQVIITDLCTIWDANSVNNIVSALTDLFFEKSSFKGDITLSFRHRRFQEYFLYLTVEEQFYNNPNILRELKLLPNKDFVINIFLKTSIKRAENNYDLQKLFPLKLFEAYLGDGYLREYDDDVIGKSRLFGVSDAGYAYSESFLYLLTTYTKEELGIMFHNRNLCIYDAINSDNVLKFIEISHRSTGINIGGFLSKELGIDIKMKNMKDIKSYLYLLYKICNISFNEILDSYVRIKIDDPISIKYVDNVISGNEIIDGIIDLALEFDMGYLTSLLKEASNALLEIVSYNLLKYKHINVLFSDEYEYSEFRKELSNVIEKYGEESYPHTLVVYGIINKKIIGKDKIELVYSEANQGNYVSWSTNIELHIAAAILLEKKNYSLDDMYIGTELVKSMYDNYDNQNDVIEQWLEVIGSCNYIYPDWLKYNHSMILGELICGYFSEYELVKKLLRELYKYQSVISIQVVLYTIFKRNRIFYENVVNQSFLEKVISNMSLEEEEYDSISESMFQFAAMYAAFDVGNKYYLMLSGVENAMIRPVYRNEELVSRVMPECLYYAYHNFWIDDLELEEYCKHLYVIQEKIKNTTDNPRDYGALKWIVNRFLNNSDLQYDLYDVDEYAIIETDFKDSYDMNLINMDNLKEYYNCRIVGAPYNSLWFWEYLIEMELSQNEELDTLYQVLDENAFPSIHGYRIVNYVHLPMVVLLNNEKTKDKFLNYLVKNSGRYSIYNMLRTTGIQGNPQEGMKYLKFMFVFLDMLIANEDLNMMKITKVISNTKNYSNVYNSMIDKWKIDEEKCEMHMIEFPNIKIIWNNWKSEKEKFDEEWATKFPDKSAYKYHYTLYDENDIIKEFELVKVDGYRATLPIPRVGTMFVNRDDYLLCRLFNDNLDELKRYMRMAKLVVL